MPTNDGPVLMDFIFGRPEQFQNYAWHQCSKIITPTVNIIAYDSLFNVVIDIDDYLNAYHLTSWHLNPAAAGGDQHTIDTISLASL